MRKSRPDRRSAKPGESFRAHLRRVLLGAIIGALVGIPIACLSRAVFMIAIQKPTWTLWNTLVMGSSFGIQAGVLVGGLVAWRRWPWPVGALCGALIAGAWTVLPTNLLHRGEIYLPGLLSRASVGFVVGALTMPLLNRALRGMD